MRPERATDAHKTDKLAELVCSNSFRSDDAENNAVGLLHEEMRRAGSLIMRCADANQVPAGGALAVDRDGFAEAVTAAIAEHPGITVRARRGRRPAAGGLGQRHPRHRPAHLARPRRGGPRPHRTRVPRLLRRHRADVHFETIDMGKAWFQSRYDKPGPGGTGADYINCPMNRDEYEAFVDALLAGEKTEFKAFEGTPYFDGCLPVEVMAERGRETLRHGPMKPVGLTNPHDPAVKSHAIVQLRQDNALGTLYNMVGFQTKLKYAEQMRVFRMIPGLENAQFARLGGLHRNTYLDSPRLLDPTLRLKAMPRLRFAGQVTGCEGYVESAAVGLLAGRFAAAERHGQALLLPPPTTAFGALLGHITGGHISVEGEGPRSFQPMNVNFGLFPDIEPVVEPGKRLKGPERGAAKRRAMSPAPFAISPSGWPGSTAPRRSETGSASGRAPRFFGLTKLTAAGRRTLGQSGRTFWRPSSQRPNLSL